LAAGGDDPPIRVRGAGTATRLRDRREPDPAARAGVVRLETVRVRVDPGAAAAERIDPVPCRGRRQVLTGRRPGDALPASRAQVEREGDAGEATPPVDAADDVQLP